MKPKEVLKAFDKLCDTFMQDSCEFGVEHARHTTLFNHTNEFEADITYIYIPKAKTAIVVSNRPYSSYLEFGNPYAGFVIQAINAKALHWVDHTTGQDVFRKTSTAHGPLPFMQQASDAINDNVDQLWTNAIAKVFNV